MIAHRHLFRAGFLTLAKLNIPRISHELWRQPYFYPCASQLHFK